MNQMQIRMNFIRGIHYKGGIYNTREQKREREGERCKGMLPVTVEEYSIDAHIF